MNRRSVLLYVYACVAAAVATVVEGVEVRAAAAPVDFGREIQPILAKHCFSCHGPDESEGGLRLHDRDAAMSELDSGEFAIVPGDVSRSVLIHRVTATDEDVRMPPEGKPLTATEISLLKRWVEEGANWQPHWAFTPVTRPAVPRVEDAGWPRNPIDAFVLARLERSGLGPAGPADRVALLRRAYYDLTGLPPSPAEVDAFLADDSPTAYEDLVDKLLASPRYGEKWGRHWLDLVRFAETNSFERDNPKPHAWRYRDYVIRAFNDDTPYDVFVREQLAGDELAEPTPDSIIATGYYRLGLWDDEPSDALQARYDELDDLVKTTGQVFLGLTLDCARCHDHKIDPVPQTDYYRMLAFFHNIRPMQTEGDNIETPIFASAKSKDDYLERLREQREQVERIEAEISGLESEFKTRYAKAASSVDQDQRDVARLIRDRGEELLGQAAYRRYRDLRGSLRKLKSNRIEADRALCVKEFGRDAPKTFVLTRGSAHAPGIEVEPGYPSILGSPNPVVPGPSPGAKSSGRRSVLARWITSPDNKLSARVMVNRIWQHHFGRGIVRSPNNFGMLGDRPTHPRLLDWLASEFVRRRWRIKDMHRLIMTSNTYRMSSQGNPRAYQNDPGNDLFWRFDMRRLNAEEIRDSLLAVSGKLNCQMYGPGVYPAIPREVMQGQSQPGKGWGDSSPADQARRSVYIHVKRSLLTPLLETFDLADTDNTCPVRFTTTQPTQALAMVNSDLLQHEAADLANRLRGEAGDDVVAQVTRALRLVTSRRPDKHEVQRGLELIGQMTNEDGLTHEESLKYFCLMALNLNEFIYLD